MESRTPIHLALLSAYLKKSSNRVGSWKAVSTVWDWQRRFHLATAMIISSWMYTVVVVLVMKLVISAFKTGCLLFLPLICLDSTPYWIDRCSLFSIFTIFSVVTFQSWDFLAILFSKNSDKGTLPCSWLLGILLRQYWAYLDMWGMLSSILSICLIWWTTSWWHSCLSIPLFFL